MIECQREGSDRNEYCVCNALLESLVKCKILCCSQSRWTSAACPLPHAATSPSSCPSIHAASFSSAASPEVSGKPGAPGASSDDATTVASSEEKDEPIQPPFTADEKGGTGRFGPNEGVDRESVFRAGITWIIKLQF